MLLFKFSVSNLQKVMADGEIFYLTGQNEKYIDRRLGYSRCEKERFIVISHEVHEVVKVFLQ